MMVVLNFHIRNSNGVGNTEIIAEEETLKRHVQIQIHRKQKLTGLLLFLVIKVVVDSSGQLPSLTHLMYALIMLFTSLAVLFFACWLANTFPFMAWDSESI